MANNKLDQRIDEVSDGVIGVLTALLNARQMLGDKYVEAFLNKVPEKGEALWQCFRAFQKKSKDGGATMEMTFNHFIASILVPVPFPN